MKKRPLRNISLPFTWNDLLSRDRIKSIAKFLYQRFIKIRGRPEDIAWGMAIGLFIGMTPTIGIQIYIAVFIASILKKSKMSAAIGVWITNPITIPFFYGLTYYLGAKILGYPLRKSLLQNFSFETLQTAGKSIFISLWIGGIIAGLAVAIIGYMITLEFIVHGREKAKRLGKKRAKGQSLRIISIVWSVILPFCWIS
jgi:uncharacterized protein (DUF2062 family)